VKISGFQIRHYADDGRDEQDQNSHDNLQLKFCETAPEYGHGPTASS
jgi:hypothetical protein